MVFGEGSKIISIEDMFWQKKKPKILIVEDTLRNHDLYRDIFKQEGFEVTICQSADGDFISEVVSFSPDIISMDLMLGKKDAPTQRNGFQAIELLKSDPQTKSIPIIILSNFSDSEKVRYAKELGVVDFLSIQGHSIVKIPKNYSRYLKSPKRYLPSHPLFKSD